MIAVMAGIRHDAVSAPRIAEAGEGPLIAILLDHIESDYHVEIIESAIRVAERRGARTLIIPGGALDKDGRPGKSRGFIYKLLGAANLDGIMLLGGALSNYSGIEGFEQFYRSLPRVPAVVVGLDTPAAMCVAVNNHHGVSQVVDHLVQKHKRRKIAYIDGPSGSTESRIRRQAYIDSIKRHDLPVDQKFLVPGGLARENGIDAVVTLFEDRHLDEDDLDAIVCVNDDTALGVLEELRRRGIRVPEQIAVVGFDDAPHAHTAIPPLTTVSQRVYEQAEMAMNRLLDGVKSGTQLSRDEVLPDFVARQSCGCEPKMSNDSTSWRGTAGSAQSLADEKSTIADSIVHVARGRLSADPNWAELLVAAVLDEYKGKKGAFVANLAQLSRASGETAIDVCHEVLTRLRLRVLKCLAPTDPMIASLEDAFQEGRLALANRSLFSERARHTAQAHHLRAVARACLDRAHGADLSELAVALDEQLPMFGIKKFVISQGERSDLRVVARSSSRAESREVVTTATLGRDAAMMAAEHVVILPLSSQERQVGLAVLSYGNVDPFVLEQLRDLLGMALAMPGTPTIQQIA